MKKFSKESMQNFMLLHAEKLVLGACLAASGLFVWTSMGSGEKPLTKSPTNLVDDNDKAQRYMKKDSWEELAPFRQGKSSAEQQIANAEPVDASKFSFTIVGPPAASLARRNDPEIFRPEQLRIQRFTAALMINRPADVTSPLDNLAAAPKGDGSGSSNRGSGGGNDGSGSKDDGSGTKDGSSSKGSALRPLYRSSVVNEVNSKTMVGLQPVSLGISPDQAITQVFDMVAVTALVDFKKQSAAFEKAFAESVAYNSKRDRPVYQFVQVQRREVSEQETEWTDISERVTYRIPQGNPLKPAPFQLYGSAPEVVAPENYDPVLTQNIPALAMMDYQELATHPALGKRREFPAWLSGSAKKELPSNKDGGETIFDQEFGFDREEGSGRKDDNENKNSLRKGTDTEIYQEAIALQKQSGQYRLVRFFDVLPSRKRSYEYRVRVWLGDPNQLDPSDGFRSHRGQRLEVKEGELKFVGNGVSIKEMSEKLAGNKDEPDGSDNRNSTDADQVVKRTMLSPAARKRVAAAFPRVDNEADMRAMGQMLFSPEQDKPFYVSEISGTGQLEQVELPPSASRYAYSQYLRFARPSSWSDSVRVGKNLGTADVYAGTTVRKRTDELLEPHFKVVVSYWDNNLGAKIPTERNAFVGETMNFNTPAYLTHPISWEVLVAETSQNGDNGKHVIPFETNVTIVDAIFGEKQDLPDIKRQSAEAPTEVLLMDANGNLKVSNQFTDATSYRNEIMMPDDSRFIGTARKPRKSKKDKDEDNFDFDG